MLKQLEPSNQTKIIKNIWGKYFDQHCSFHILKGKLTSKLLCRFNAFAWLNTHGPGLLRLIAIGSIIYFMGYFQWSVIYILITLATFQCHQIFKETKQNQVCETVIIAESFRIAKI
jgi:hypothetical protein